jgi:Holliday junction resolvase RusA-like endonuclease
MIDLSDILQHNEKCVALFESAVKPQGKARPRLSLSGHAYTPRNTVLAENRISLDCRRAMRFDAKPTECPVRVVIKAQFQIPRSLSHAKQTALVGCAVTKKPDADNIAKLVLDALNGVAYRDDKQVYSVSISKVYANSDAVSVAVLEKIE